MYIFLTILVIMGFAAIALGINNLWRVPDWIMEPLLVVGFIVACALLLLGVWA